MDKRIEKAVGGRKLPAQRYNFNLGIKNRDEGSGGRKSRPSLCIYQPIVSVGTDSCNDDFHKRAILYVSKAFQHKASKYKGTTRICSPCTNAYHRYCPMIGLYYQGQVARE